MIYPKMISILIMLDIYLEEPDDLAQQSLELFLAPPSAIKWGWILRLCIDGWGFGWGFGWMGVGAG
jgi:hypothetical protein